MISIFTDKIRWYSLLAEVSAWVGTPYRWMHAECGVGADCFSFITSVLSNLGYLSKIDRTRMSRYWSLGDNAINMLAGIVESVRGAVLPGYTLAQIEPANVARGDLVVTAINSRYGDHLNLYVSPHGMFTAYQRTGVVWIPTRGDQDIRGVYRLAGVG